MFFKKKTKNWEDRTILYRGKKVYIVKQITYKKKEYLSGVVLDDTTKDVSSVVFLYNVKGNIFDHVTDDKLFDELIMVAGMACTGELFSQKEELVDDMLKGVLDEPGANLDSMPKEDLIKRVDFYLDNAKKNMDEEKFYDAYNILLVSLQMCKKITEEDSKYYNCVAETYHLTGEVCLILKDYEQALILYEKALNLYSKVLENDYKNDSPTFKEEGTVYLSKCKDISLKMSDIYKRFGKKDKAKEMYDIGKDLKDRGY